MKSEQSKMGFKRFWKFSNTGSYFGVTQFDNVLSSAFFKKLEAFVITLEEKANQNFSEEDDQLWKISCDVVPKKWRQRLGRAKFFFGAKYKYGSSKKGIKLDNKVVPVLPEFLDLVLRLKDIEVVKKDFQLSQVGVNIYNYMG